MASYTAPMRAMRWIGLILSLIGVGYGCTILWLAQGGRLGYGAIPWIGIGLPAAALLFVVGTATWIAGIIVARIQKDQAGRK